ncbi:MAG: GTP 3',8-cyclase MoaA [Candidatus Methanomethylicia archaeon]|nr:GTP 3',8-cyclase MoaA [Candidatus Methanomethylicia archaeon]MCX8168979.1 GTP 3',8-cyclase MoaA [Candidatus Methanomethylicia archaeon]MDW7988711.1 GTP 3',8-cyclase MoaA [Nitrososphaerota archaeon]
MPLIDRYGRPVNYLRITLTHRCNYNCIYCHMEGEKLNYSHELTPDEIEVIVKAAVKIGINKVKFTGGEPLIRDDLLEIMNRIANIKGISDISITTNGSILSEIIKDLIKTGLKRMNVNLPSIREETYRKITNSKYTPEKIIDGINEAKRCGMKIIKVNMVVLKGINDDEINELIEFTKKNGLILQLIELENVGIKEEVFLRYHLDLSTIEDELKKKTEKIIVRKNMQNRRKYILREGGEVEVIRPYENGSFCKACTRIRLTVDGMLKPCLMRNDNLINLREAVEKKLGVKEIMNYFMKAIEVREPYWRVVNTPLKCFTLDTITMDL